MPAKHIWTDAEDATIMTMRAANAPLTAIATALGNVNRDTVGMRVRELGLSAGRVYPRADDEIADERNRWPMEPFHPVAREALERAVRMHREGIE